MNTTRELVNRYNVLAHTHNMTLLTSWKGKKSDLEQRVAALEAKTKAPIKKAVTKKAPVKKSNPRATYAGKTVTIVEIAKAHGLNPKVVRARMRRLNKRNELPAVPVEPASWTFKVEDRKALEAVLVTK